MDVVAVELAMREADRPVVAIAPCGTALSAAQVDLLRGFTNRDLIVVASDGDPAGISAARRAIRVLSGSFESVLGVPLRPDEDPADVYARGGPTAVRTILTRTAPLAGLLIEAEIDRWEPVLDHVGGRVDAVHSVSGLVAQLPVAEIAARVIWLSRRLDLDPGIVTRALLDDLTDSDGQAGRSIRVTRVSQAMRTTRPRSVEIGTGRCQPLI